MANELKGLPHHSAEYFGDTRDFWWNEDHVALLAAQWRLPPASRVLDVGCGIGHWGRVLAAVLPDASRIMGLDRDPFWVEKAAERAHQAGLGERLHYRTGEATSLPFEDATFDLVTCQTLLIHVSDPAAVLAEMVRTTKPGGLVLVAEPTNIADPVLSALALGDPPERCATMLQFHLTCTRGKKNCGEGDELVGESLPQYLLNAGLRDIELRLNDRPWTLTPPYSSPFQRAQREEALDLADRAIDRWDEATTRRYYLAGGGEETAFAPLWALTLDQLRRTATALRGERLARAGGGLFYIGWGWKPR